ncbi:hypothetical protein P20652_2271 [Pseudoalteromonas sp. BSi20652]|nr:hypothetical protein P20652_2271 [Pseudoalteromonas sp. BSi20652]
MCVNRYLCSLPHRQLRNHKHRTSPLPHCSLPHRQLRKHLKKHKLFS